MHESWRRNAAAMMAVIKRTLSLNTDEKKGGAQNGMSDDIGSGEGRAIFWVKTF